MANLALPMANARSVIKRLRFPFDIMLVCVRWYVAYPLSLRNLEEMMQERGVFVDHSTIHRWVIKLVPLRGRDSAAVLPHARPSRKQPTLLKKAWLLGRSEI